MEDVVPILKDATVRFLDCWGYTRANEAIVLMLESGALQNCGAVQQLRAEVHGISLESSCNLQQTSSLSLSQNIELQYLHENLHFLFDYCNPLFPCDASQFRFLYFLLTKFYSVIICITFPSFPALTCPVYAITNCYL